MSEKEKSSVNNATDPKEKLIADKTEVQKSFIERLESHYNGVLIKHEDVLKFSKDLYQWLYSISRYGNVDKTMIILSVDNYDYVVILFYTAENTYRITASVKSNYLGCTVSTRKPRVGEWWDRGSDLPDGDFKYKTWKKIVNGIVSYEMKNLQIDKTKIE